jgi:hypothetical protein
VASQAVGNCLVVLACFPLFALDKSSVVTALGAVISDFKRVCGELHVEAEISLTRSGDENVELACV